MKLHRVWIGLILLLSLTAGCSGGFSSSVTNKREVNIPDGCAMSYTKFSGRKIGGIIPPENFPLEVVGRIETNGGTISVFIAKDSDRETVLYSRENIPTSEFTIRISEPDQYFLWLEADDHSGSYEIHWGP